MSLEFYNDFFGSTIMNHCEFLKTLPELGKDDIDLLKSIVGNLSENSEKATNFIESQTEITDLYSELSYDELKNVLEGWLNPSGEGEADKSNQSVSQQTLSTETKSEPVAETTTTTSNAKKTDDVAAAFDDLFNN